MIKGRNSEFNTIYSLVNIKHGKIDHKKIEIDPNEDISTFMLQLFSLTNVPPERQKITFKGKVLK